MCPLCIGTAALIVSGGTCAGGLAAVVLSRLGRQPLAEGSGAQRNDTAWFILRRRFAGVPRGSTREQAGHPLF